MSDEAPDKPAAPFLSWWRACLRPTDDTAAARALRARLRRAGSVLDILAETEVHRLAAAVPYLRQRPDILADVVCTLTLVENHEPRRLARILGGGTDPAMSKARFEKLMRASRGELRTGLRRALALAGHRGNVEALARDIVNWDDDRTRQNWWFDYFHAPAPSEESKDQNREYAA